ncbi:hypothetical protein AKJ51_00620 [candidate division MSBL1 archaeon SCGC-AAA382A20]|uniref:Peptidase S9 prolyl oligopeptidase catalytic domain-containing protein n=1 Tax=candidate division MSBL1 archaeon SCGC-AAA382A20 TaxID=1698280 RepID=A0A133VML0_9EURY|nr:hypothetical protein AKJ51_00620 [candidate division MSBL1 archaeon SCGC-AAA382A20]
MVEQVSFLSDGLEIKGDLRRRREGAPCVVALHGLTGDKDKGMWPAISSRMESEGYACLKFNFRGCGEKERSEGRFEDTTLSARIEDFRTALDYLEGRKDVYTDRIGVVGASLGGMVAMGSQDERINATVVMASPYKIPRYDRPRRPVKKGEYYVLPSGEKFKQKFYIDLKNYDMRKYIRNASPVLIIQGDSDGIVPVEHARTLYASASEPKRLEIIENADHAFSNSEPLGGAMDLIVDWFDDYL